MQLPPVPAIAEGSPLDADTLNGPARALAIRTDVLRDELTSLAATGGHGAVVWAQAPLATAGGVLAVRRVVYMNPDTGLFEAALAEVAADNLYKMDMAARSMAVGFLSYVSTDGATGTVVLSGRQPLSDSGGDWEMAEAMESGDAYRDGPLYLSASEAGKLTTRPSGPMVLVGYFKADTAAGVGGTAIIGFQHREFYHSHVHRPIGLRMAPAGGHEYDAAVSSPEHVVHGYYSDAWRSGSAQGAHTGGDGTAGLTDVLQAWFTEDLIGLTVTNLTNPATGVITGNTTTEITADMRDASDAVVLWSDDDEYVISDRAWLRVRGTWRDTLPTVYTVWLADEAGTSGPVTYPGGFDDAWLHWTSDNPDEPAGSVRVVGFDHEVRIGTLGLCVSLQNALEDQNTGWSWAGVSQENLDRRRWTVSMPEHARGWSEPFHTGAATKLAGSDAAAYPLLLAGPTEAVPRASQTVYVRTGKIVCLTYTGIPSSGDSLVLGGVSFVFGDLGDVTGSSALVEIAAGSAEQTYENLIQAMGDIGLVGVYPAHAPALGKLFIAMPTSLSVVGYEITDAVYSVIFEGGDQDLDAGGTALLVHDEDNQALVSDTGYWHAPTFHVPAVLTSGLRLSWLRTGLDGTAVSGIGLPDGAAWSARLTGLTVGHPFVYRAVVHGELADAWPPVPLESVGLVVDGLDRASSHVHTEGYDYSVAADGLYWSRRAGLVPFPDAWSYPGDDEDVIGTAHVTRMRLAEAGTVTSLRPAATAPIVLRRPGTTDVARTGDLELDVDFTMRTGGGAAPGHLVVKQFRGNRGILGPVVERIIDGPGYTVRAVPGMPSGQGTVQLLLGGTGSSGAFTDIALRNGKIEMFDDAFPYIRLLGWTYASSTNVDSGLRARFTVPYDLAGAWRFNWAMTVFGLDAVAAGPEYAGLEITYRVLRDYAPSGDYTGTLADNLIAPPASTVVRVPMGAAGTYAAADPFVVHSDPSLADLAGRRYLVHSGPFPGISDLKSGVPVGSLSDVVLYAGSQVSLSIQRTGLDTDEYVHDLGILNLRWSLTAAS